MRKVHRQLPSGWLSARHPARMRFMRQQAHPADASAADASVADFLKREG